MKVTQEKLHRFLFSIRQAVDITAMVAIVVDLIGLKRASPYIWIITGTAYIIATLLMDSRFCRSGTWCKVMRVNELFIAVTGLGVIASAIPGSMELRIALGMAMIWLYYGLWLETNKRWEV